jgi:hypothetical protein
MKMVVGACQNAVFLDCGKVITNVVDSIGKDRFSYALSVK